MNYASPSSKVSSTPLLCAVAKGNVPMVFGILKASSERLEQDSVDDQRIPADVSKPRRDGVSPLIMATQMGHLPLIRLLASQPQCKLAHRSLYPVRVSALHVSMRAMNPEATHALLQWSERWGVSPKEYELELDPLPAVAARLGCPPAMCAMIEDYALSGKRLKPMREYLAAAGVEKDDAGNPTGCQLDADASTASKAKSAAAEQEKHAVEATGARAAKPEPTAGEHTADEHTSRIRETKADGAEARLAHAVSGQSSISVDTGTTGMRVPGALEARRNPRCARLGASTSVAVASRSPRAGTDAHGAGSSTATCGGATAESELRALREEVRRLRGALRSVGAAALDAAAASATGGSPEGAS